jgi:hypothetical protein
MIDESFSSLITLPAGFKRVISSKLAVKHEPEGGGSLSWGSLDTFTGEALYRAVLRRID